MTDSETNDPAPEPRPPHKPPTAGAEGEAPAEWWLDRLAAKALYVLIRGQDPTTEALDGELSKLALTHGDVVHAELIFLLTRLRLDPADARRHWPAVLMRQKDMEERLGHGVDLRAAMLSYFVDVERHLARPKVVEMDWAEKTMASALLDEVTGLPNQRFFREQLARDVERSLRDNSPLSLIVLDADDFRQVNDRLGHDVGTATLCEIARRLREHARDSDLVVRYGGDEFVVLCPSTPKFEAGRLADDLRRAVACHTIEPADGSAPLVITVSAGVATCPADARDGAMLFALADRAAYQAKDAGRNRVQLAGGSTRSYARRKVNWSGHVVPVGSAGYSIETVEIGEGGFSYRTGQGLPPDTLVETTLVTPDGVILRRAARIAWCRPAPQVGWEIAVRFVEAGGEDRRHLARWIQGDAEYSLDAVGAPARRAGFEPQSKSAFLR